MSLRSKKSNQTKKKHELIDGYEEVRSTPPIIENAAEKKKTKSSMKKLKKLLKNSSKTKSVSMESPSVDRLRRENNHGSTVYNKVDEKLSGKEAVRRVRSSKRCRDKSPDSFVDNKPVKRMRTIEQTSKIKSDDKATFSSSGSKLSDMVVNCSPLDKAETRRRTPVQPEKFFKSIISPVTVTTFFREIWERKPLLIRRHNPDYNKEWFSTEELDHILREEVVKFGENVDVVTYMNGKRETHNPVGRAYAPVVWDFYQNGCSVRLLNPHSYSFNVWSRLAVLQEYFGCVAGANIYLTPPGSQGFAPHWDDIEAFVLQLEGKKHWRVYEPRNDSEVLPRESSPNFSDGDLTDPPVLDAVLEPGDLLYFPRGFIHQGRTMEESHSLHITVSVGQKNTWGDLLHKLLPRALDIAIEEDVEYRQSLPHSYLNYMGVAFSEEETAERNKFHKTVEKLFNKLLPFAPIDAACDQMAKEFLQNSLPPALTDGERLRSVHGNGEHWDVSGRRVRGAVEIEPDTQIRIIRRGCVRLVMEEGDKVFIYHNMENARMLHNEDASQCIEVEAQMAEGVEFLLKRFPDFVTVDSLPLDTVQERVALATDLYDRGLVLTREPLESFSDDDSCCESHGDSSGSS